MKIIEKNIKGLIEIVPRVFEDARGEFFESYNKKVFESAGIVEEFVQDNQSFSKKGVLRGLHFQNSPHAQGKLVRVIQGRVLDVAVDLRKSSPTFGQYDTVVLDAKMKNMFWIPPGFAHGFLALEDCIFAYKCTALYNKEAESGIIWNDTELNIEWGMKDPLVSEKDLELPTFGTFVNNLLVR